MIKILKAEEGKVWKSLKEGWIGSDTLILGSNDSITNYTQVDKPVEEVADGEQQTMDRE